MRKTIPVPVPANAYERTEWAFARLKYPSGRYAGFWGGRGSWPTDFPKADRQFVTGVSRLTRIHARSSEQIIDLSDAQNPREVFNWPWVYAVEVGHWDLTDAQCALLREYLLRGGFLMVDDFHGNYEWDVFTQSMNRIFPDRAIVEIPDSDPIFHTIYDLNHRLQVPGIVYLESHQLYEHGGTIPHWRGIYDDHGRVMAAMDFQPGQWRFLGARRQPPVRREVHVAGLQAGHRLHRLCHDTLSKPDGTVTRRRMSKRTQVKPPRNKPSPSNPRKSPSGIVTSHKSKYLYFNTLSKRANRSSEGTPCVFHSTSPERETTSTYASSGSA